MAILTSILIVILKLLHHGYHRSQNLSKSQKNLSKMSNPLNQKKRSNEYVENSASKKVIYYIIVYESVLETEFDVNEYLNFMPESDSYESDSVSDAVSEFDSSESDAVSEFVSSESDAVSEFDSSESVAVSEFDSSESVAVSEFDSSESVDVSEFDSSESVAVSESDAVSEFDLSEFDAVSAVVYESEYLRSIYGVLLDTKTETCSVQVEYQDQSNDIILSLDDEYYDDTLLFNNKVDCVCESETEAEFAASDDIYDTYYDLIMNDKSNDIIFSFNNDYNSVYESEDLSLISGTLFNSVMV